MASKKVTLESLQAQIKTIAEALTILVSRLPDEDPWDPETIHERMDGMAEAATKSSKKMKTHRWADVKASRDMKEDVEDGEAPGDLHYIPHNTKANLTTDVAKVVACPDCAATVAIVSEGETLPPSVRLVHLRHNC